MGKLVMVRAEPTEAMCSAGQHHIEMPDDEDGCSMGTGYEAKDAYRAMISASPDLTDEEIDGLCRMMWPKHEMDQPGWEHMKKRRRALMCAFLTSLKDNNHG